MESEQKLSRVWDNFIEVGEAMKTGAKKFVVSIACREGQRYIVVREFYLKRKTGEWRPGLDGITIPIAVPLDEGKTILLPWQDIARLFEKAVPQAIEMELYDEANAVYVSPKSKLKRTEIK